MKILSRLLDLLYPPRCPFCRRLLFDSDALLCRDCRRRWVEQNPAGFRREIAHTKCVLAPLAYEGQIRESLHRYKFGGVTAYARTYAEILGKCIDENQISCDIITWVPLSRKRLRRRGYDQARLIAEELARVLQTECRPLLRKTVHTKPQSRTGDAAKRKANAAGVYCCPYAEAVRGKRILLVDDIVTTGATLSECARVLKAAGAAEIVGAAVASRN